MRIRHPEITKEIIEGFYSEGKSSIEIATILGCGKSSILRKMRKCGLARRTVGQALAGKTIPQKVRRKMSEAAKKRQQGDNHTCWKGGRFITSSGYVSVWKKDHPFASSKGYIPEHRLVMEKKIGRYLSPEEQVHHINGIRHDNRPENLELCASMADHCKKHGGGMNILRLTLAEAKAEMLRVYAIIGDPFTRDRFNEVSRFHSVTIFRRFGWHKHLPGLGIPIVYHKK